MPINSDEFPFTKENVDLSPAKIGVYALLNSNKGVLYYGRAVGDGVTIRSRLQDHLAGRGDSVASRAAYYKREVCSDPVNRESELLAAYKRNNGDYPPGNQRGG